VIPLRLFLMAILQTEVTGSGFSPLPFFRKAGEDSQQDVNPQGQDLCGTRQPGRIVEG